MGKTLIIAEKPSVARDIAKVLKCNARGNGCLLGQNYIVSWAVGHLVSLAEPDDYDPALKKWDFSKLPIIPNPIKLKGIASTKDQLGVLTSLMASDEVSDLICATDSGREGELIFRYIYLLTNCKKPFQRLWISSMTDAAIQEGFKKLKPGSAYDNLYLSAKCRSEADWLVGINATRAFTLKYNALLSIGRVQTPTLAIIVAKQKEIEAFQVTEYYEVWGNYPSFKGVWFQEAEGNTKIMAKKTAEELAAKIQGQTGTVAKVEEEEKQQPPPLLYDLTELQRDCNKKFGFSAQKTLTVAQSLYETKKLITYPRTDSRYLSDDMVGKIQATLHRLKAVTGYQDYANRVLALPKLPLSKRIIDNSKVSDHHAMIPTDHNLNVKNLSQEERQVFHLIALRFLAVFYPNYIYSTTKVVVEVVGEALLSKGTSIIALGWQELYRQLEAEAKGKKATTKEDQLLPVVACGDPVLVEQAQVLKKKTQPPKAYTEATLLSAMENAGRFIEDEELREELKDAGLGTPATRASIIERLISVGYITRKGKALVPTEKGTKLIEIVPDELKSPQTTGKWEKALGSIAQGKMTEERFMASIKRYVQYLVVAGAKVNPSVVFPDEGKKFQPKGKAMGTCPHCGEGKVYENSKSYFCSRWKEGCKFSLWKSNLQFFAEGFTDKMLKTLLEKGELCDVPIIHPQKKTPAQAKVVLTKDLKQPLALEKITELPPTQQNEPSPA